MSSMHNIKRRCALLGLAICMTFGMAGCKKSTDTVDISNYLKEIEPDKVGKTSYETIELEVTNYSERFGAIASAKCEETPVVADIPYGTAIPLNFLSNNNTLVKKGAKLYQYRLEFDEVFAITEYLLERKIKALVVACNTATSAAIAQIRERYPELVVVGIEPAIKPAITEHPDRDILVLATPFTLREEKFKTLSERFANSGHIVSLPSIELVEFVERGDLDSPELLEYLQEKLAPYLAQTGRIGAVVLGCTHFPFLRRALERVLPEEVPVYDGGAGTARQTRRCLEHAGLLRTVGASHICMINTKEKEEFRAIYLDGTFVSDVPAQGLYDLSMKLLLNE